MKYEIREHQCSARAAGSLLLSIRLRPPVWLVFPVCPTMWRVNIGVVGLTKTAALEYAKSGIRVNAVCPGVIQTPMVERGAQLSPGFDELAVSMEPVGRFGQPAEVGEAVVWLCSDAASFVTGIPMQVDGGLVAQ